MAARQHSAEPWGAAGAAHLLSRAAFGPTPEAVARLAAMTRQAAVKTVIVDATWAPLPTPPDWVRHPWLNTQRGWGDTPPDVLADNHGRTTARYANEMDDLRAWWLREMVRTTGPLREVMTLFWHGHFTSSFQKVRISQSMYEQNAVFRRHALGNFRELLNAVLRDSAMMLYLDMEEMTGERHNENLARELCELFTLGPGDYRESDVREIARALTGWTLDVPAGVVRPNRPDAPRLHRALRRDGLVARFVPERHDGGTKTILGRTGAFGLNDVADILVAHPATARFLAGRLIALFGASDPHGALQGRLADTFTAHAESDVQLARVVEALLASPEFDGAAARGNQVKSPVRLLVGAARQLALEIDPTPNLARYVESMGQRLFDPPNVEGWPGGETWLNAGSMSVRFHLGDVLLDGRLPAGLEPLAVPRSYARARDSDRARAVREIDEARAAARQANRDALGLPTRFEAEALLSTGVPATPEGLVEALLDRLVLRSPPDSARRTMVAAARHAPPERRVSAVVRLILASPEYQVA